MTNRAPCPRRRWRSILAVALAIGPTACRHQPSDATGAVTARTLGLVYLQENRLDQAEAEFQKVIRIAPDQALGYANLGLVYLRQDRYREAERRLERAVRLDSSNVHIQLMLATVYRLTDRPDQARALLDRLLEAHPADPGVLYAEAELAPPGDSGRADLLARLVAATPRNLAARAELVLALARRGLADSAAAAIEELRQLPPEPPPEVGAALVLALDALRAGRAADAVPDLERWRHRLETTAGYQAGLQEIKGPGGALVGYPVLTFRPNFEIRERIGREAESTLVRFTDATGPAGLAGPPGVANPVIVAGDWDGDGTDDLFAGGRLYHNDGGQLVPVAGGPQWPAPAAAAAVGDVDNDGRLDLYVVGGDGRGRLGLGVDGAPLREAASPDQGLPPAVVRAARFVDFDHDGDLDLVLATDAGLRALRNNLDGTFRDVTVESGLAGGPATDLAYLDFDGDGLLDLYAAGPSGDHLYRNTGLRRFEDVTARAGIGDPRSTVVRVGDYDNDGLLDLALGATGIRLFRNAGDGTFTADPERPPGNDPVTALRFLDYDNDGRLDLVALTDPPAGFRLFRRDDDGGWRDRSSLVPSGSSGLDLAVLDADRDGDEDLVVVGTSGLRMLRNDGGNRSQYLDVRLTGLRTGSGKNNAFGVGARIDVRAGDLYQTRVVTERVTHFGLGDRLKADVVRIEWPNGVPQTVFFPGSSQDVLEQQILKGSCAFLYTWDGERYTFVGDVMWKSALGMPLGIMGSQGSAFAPPAASREHLLIPGDRLRPERGRYRLQLTEELWETAYLDQVRLLAVDHPDSVPILVDEKFVSPAEPAPLRLHHVVGLRPPIAASDERGRDLLPLLRERDSRYVGDFTPTRYQGLVASHDLVLDLGPLGAGRPILALTGWIFPTDASINVALGQARSLERRSPSLEVRDRDGRWRPAIADIGFPSGKDKTVLVDLSGRFPTDDHRVRIRTNLAIHWDQVQVGGAVAGAATVTTLAPLAADLHERGYSRLFRKGGRNGPHWFDYDSVTPVSPWRPIAGRFTRFGDVRPLLEGADDEYVIMAPGDETTVEFDAGALPAIPAGWRRDFVLYTDGWIKDADRNTAHGQTVEPLPFHAIRRYPPGPGDGYPADTAHRRYRAIYNTRAIEFR